MTTFRPHVQAESRRRSAVALIKVLLKINTPEARPRDIDKLIDSMLWAITEADGKFNTRHRSEAAIHCQRTDLLHHEHVFPKKSMILRLRKAQSEQEVDQTLSLAIGCLVMRDEHKLLDHGLVYDSAGGNGWERYHKANINVVNIETGQRVPMMPMSGQS